MLSTRHPPFRRLVVRLKKARELDGKKAKYYLSLTNRRFIIAVKRLQQRGIYPPDHLGKDEPHFLGETCYDATHGTTSQPALLVAQIVMTSLLELRTTTAFCRANIYLPQEWVTTSVGSERPRPSPRRKLRVFLAPVPAVASSSSEIPTAPESWLLDSSITSPR